MRKEETGISKLENQTITRNCINRSSFLNKYIYDIPETVFTADQNGDIIKLLKAENDFGKKLITLETIKNFSDFLPEEQAMEITTSIKDTIAEKKISVIKLLCVINGSEFRLKFYIFPWVTDEALFLVFDISEQEKNIAEYQTKKLNNKNIDIFRDAIIKKLSHEIRTPLNYIVGFTSLLNEPDLKREQLKEYAGYIIKGSDKLVEVLHEVIVLADIRAGFVETRYEKVQIKDLLLKAKKRFDQKYQEKNIAVKINNDIPNVLNYIFADSNKIVSVLSILLSTISDLIQEGSINMGCRLKGSFVEFYTESMIKPLQIGDQSKVFQSFSFSTENNLEGLGLGLEISKSYALLMGGDIGFKTDPSGLSSFVFSIPFIAS